MAIISMKQLLEAGVHFGHQTRRWNPKMAEYIFTERNGIYIIDLQKTVKKVEEAYYFIREVAMNGQGILFVGTKKQAQDSIKDEAIRSEQFYVNARWLGGMLTNFKTIRKRIDRLKELTQMEEEGIFGVLPKKEVIKLKHEMAKLEKYLGGIKDMKELPGALFVVDPRKERNAILEARKIGIPVVAIVDTNCDPDEVDYVIPGNDDAIRAVKLIAAKMADAVIEGRQGEQMSSGEEEQQVEQKAERKPEQKAEQKAERKPEQKAEQKTEQQVEQKAERKPEQKAEQKTEQKVEQKVEQKAEQKTEQKEEQKAEQKAEQKTEQKEEQKAEQKTEQKEEQKEVATEAEVVAEA